MHAVDPDLIGTPCGVCMLWKGFAYQCTAGSTGAANNMRLCLTGRLTPVRIGLPRMRCSC